MQKKYNLIMILQKKIRRAELTLRQGQQLPAGIVKLLESSWQNCQPNEQLHTIAWEKIQEYKISRLSFQKYKIKFQQISDINFPQLKTLILQCNRIESIEPLSRIFLPNLQYLDLEYNNLTTVAGFGHCNFPKLDYLILRNNYIDGERCGELAKMHWPELRSLCLWGMVFNSRTWLGIGAIIKMESKHIFYLSCSRGINLPNRAARTLRRKYVDLRL